MPSSSVDANPPIALCMDPTDHDCLHFCVATLLFVASSLHPTHHPKISSIHPLSSPLYSNHISCPITSESFTLFLSSPSSPSPFCALLNVPRRSCLNLLFSCYPSLFPLPFFTSYIIFIPLLTSHLLATDKTSR